MSLMTYVSLYRRYRPQRFEQLIGQEHLVDTLRNAVREDRVGHAYLFSGPRGTGKTTAARIFAKALNCLDLEETGEPCDVCESCRAIRLDISMDVTELDAASNNSVDDMRELIAETDIANAGRRKVYILDEVHMLSLAASNALLKTLEEPPTHVVFVLATTNPEKVLETIRSRTQHITLSLVRPAVLGDYIRQVASWAEAPVDDEIVMYALEQANGSVRDGLSALDTVFTAGGIPSHVATVSALDDLIRILADNDLAAMFSSVEDMIANGADARDLAERLARRLRNALLFTAADGSHEALHFVDPAILRDLVATVSADSVTRMLYGVCDVLPHMPQSGDRRLTLETALTKVMRDRVVLPSGGQQMPALTESAAASASPPVGRLPPDPVDQPTSDSAAQPDPQSDDRHLDRLRTDWESQIIIRLKPPQKTRFRNAKLLSFDGRALRLTLPPNIPHRDMPMHVEKLRTALREHLGGTVAISVADPADDTSDDAPRLPLSPSAVADDPASTASSVVPVATATPDAPNKADRVLQAFL